MNRIKSFIAFVVCVGIQFSLTTAHCNAQYNDLTASTGCGISTSGNVLSMGQAGGWTITVPAGCSGNAYGFDWTQNGLFYTMDGDAGTSDFTTYDYCQSNLTVGKAVFVGTTRVYYRNTSNANDSRLVSLRAIVTFTNTSGSPITPRMNDFKLFHATNISFRINVKVEVWANDITNATSNPYSGWTPALTFYDGLSTIPTYSNQVQSGWNGTYYKIGIYPAASSVTTSGTFGTNAARSTGANMTYTNPSGANIYYGLDAATSVQLSYNNNNFTQDGNVLIENGVSSYASGGIITFSGCSDWYHRNSSGTPVTSNFETRARITINTAFTYRDGYLFFTIPPGGNVSVNVKFEVYIPNTSTIYNYGLSGWRPVYDACENTGSVSGTCYYMNVYWRQFNADNYTPGTTITWDGSVDQAWEKPCNWDCRVPTWDDPVVIPSAPANWPVIDGDVDSSPAAGLTTTNAQVKNITIAGSVERLRLQDNAIIDIQD